MAWNLSDPYYISAEKLRHYDDLFVKCKDLPDGISHPTAVGLFAQSGLPSDEIQLACELSGCGRSVTVFQRDNFRIALHLLRLRTDGTISKLPIVLPPQIRQFPPMLSDSMSLTNSPSLPTPSAPPLPSTPPPYSHLVTASNLPPPHANTAEVPADPLAAPSVNDAPNNLLESPPVGPCSSGNPICVAPVPYIPSLTGGSTSLPRRPSGSLAGTTTRSGQVHEEWSRRNLMFQNLATYRDSTLDRLKQRATQDQEWMKSLLEFVLNKSAADAAYASHLLRHNSNSASTSISGPSGPMSEVLTLLASCSRRIGEELYDGNATVDAQVVAHIKTLMNDLPDVLMALELAKLDLTNLLDQHKRNLHECSVRLQKALNGGEGQGDPYLIGIEYQQMASGLLEMEASMAKRVNDLSKKIHRHSKAINENIMKHVHRYIEIQCQHLYHQYNQWTKVLSSNMPNQEVPSESPSTNPFTNLPPSINLTMQLPEVITFEPPMKPSAIACFYNPSTDVLMEGSLDRQSQFLRQWRFRYFILTKNGFLHSYLPPTRRTSASPETDEPNISSAPPLASRGLPHDSICLKDANVQSVEGGHEFTLSLPSGWLDVPLFSRRWYRFSARSAGEREQWMTALGYAINPSLLPRDPAAAAPSAPPPPSLSGNTTATKSV